MSPYNDFKEDINNALNVLRKGGIILYPTDSIWGIGCDATNEKAVSNIYDLKKRSDFKSMLVLLDSENRLNYYVKEVPEIAWELIELTDKPLTIIYPGARNLAENLIAIDGSIGIRITREEFSSELIRRFGKPLVATSANVSEKKAPSRFSDIEEKILDGVDYVVNYRQNDIQPLQPSGIIRIGLKGEVEVLRQ
ncbi:MAG: L-threonylcarbamoyladenylate synthase [Bacteroidales bacterium]